MPAEDDIFDLPTGDPKPPPRKTGKRKPPRKKVAKSKPATATEPPPDPIVEEEADAPAETEAAVSQDDLEMPVENETREAKSIDRNVLGEADKAAMANTLPQAENPVNKAKRENPQVALWDEFLSGLTKGTMGMLHEMGIAGLTSGARALTNFRRSDLVKPKGLMLEQHADAVEGGLSKLDLSLLPEATGGVIRSGDKLPNNVIPISARHDRDQRRRKLRSTM